MTKGENGNLKPDAHMGCFGEFEASDAVCRKYCALRLRCAIERDQTDRMEMIEDMISYDNLDVILQ